MVLSDWQETSKPRNVVAYFRSSPVVEDEARCDSHAMVGSFGM